LGTHFHLVGTDPLVLCKSKIVVGWKIDGIQWLSSESKFNFILAYFFFEKKKKK
jgi:hypothetical protein